MKLLAISGSLRAASLNTSVLQAAQRLAPAGVDVEIFNGIASFPFLIRTSKPGSFPGKSSAFAR